ncbi:hypothetical protein Fmac_013284 [Flemingia macrophylla]|uniref:Uncharacterized protein n=1 Tax=Flemingia macrophylla TaxID=520843 RepID=A0ABD1MTL7_9FABA
MQHFFPNELIVENYGGYKIMASLLQNKVFVSNFTYSKFRYKAKLNTNEIIL